MSQVRAGKTSAGKDKDVFDSLPSSTEARAAFEPALTPRLAHARRVLASVCKAPPQVLLLEGSTLAERFSLALWNTALLLCEHVPSDVTQHAPCLACPTCLGVGAMLLPDIHVLDGRSGSIKIDEVRALRPLLAEPAHGSRRVVILAEAQSLGTAAANALLKSLEEPLQRVSFMLLTPQREQLLPTLVSRSWVFTLPWPPVEVMPEDMQLWEATLAHFLETGQGLFAQTAQKGAVTIAVARILMLLVQKTLVAVLAHKGGALTGASAPVDTPVKALAHASVSVVSNTVTGVYAPPQARQPLSPLGAHFARLPDAGCLYVQDLIMQADESLEMSVNPGLVIDWFATRLYRACKASASSLR